jgi:hypothetical protein
MHFALLRGIILLQRVAQGQSRMTHFLISEENPDGYKLEDILTVIRNDVLKRALKIAEDRRPEAQHVMRNNTRILSIITEAIELAEDSSKILDRAFGPSKSQDGGAPRIGGA